MQHHATLKSLALVIQMFSGVFSPCDINHMSPGFDEIRYEWADEAFETGNMGEMLGYLQQFNREEYIPIFHGRN